ncbi:MAG TPA: tyrosine-type recombinase/integrase [Thermoanaerobaculia bacterium]|nr:tyrosine-type recombinase/integrase [Thermoanaerobaculia bacterium]
MPKKTRPRNLPAGRSAQPSPRKGQRYPPEPLTEEEMMRLLSQFSREGSAGLRDRALLAMQWRAGLRIAEALALAPKDVDAKTGDVRVLEGKGRKTRVTALDELGLSILREWLARRAQLGLTARHPLFCTISEPGRGAGLHPGNWNQRLKVAARAAGIGKRVSSHTLRHSAATELDAAGYPLTDVQLFLGHTSPVTTAVYLTQLNPHRLLERLRSRRPPQPQAGA